MKLLFTLILLCAGLFANTLQEIRNSGVIRVGVRDGRPPFSEISGGKFEGFEIELANAIAKAIFGAKQGEVQFISLSAADRVSYLVNNKVDIVAATFVIDSARKNHVDFSMPYFSTNLGVLTRKADAIKDISRLRDMRLITEEGTTVDNYLKKEKFSNVSYCKNTSECYAMIRDGKADGYVNLNITVLAYAVVDDTLEVPFKNLGAAEFLGVGVQKGNQSLLDFINADLIKLSKEGFFERAYNETFEPFYKKAVDKRYFLLDGIYSFL